MRGSSVRYQFGSSSQTTVRVLTKAVTAGLVSSNEFQAGSEATRTAIATAGDEGANAVEEMISERLNKAGEEREALSDFREVLSELAIKLAEPKAGETAPHPLIFIIDELARIIHESHRREQCRR